MDESERETTDRFAKLLAACWTRNPNEIAYVLIEYEKPAPSIAHSVMTIALAAIEFYRKNYHESTASLVLEAINNAIQIRRQRLGPELWSSRY